MPNNRFWQSKILFIIKLFADFIHRSGLPPILCDFLFVIISFLHQNIFFILMNEAILMSHLEIYSQ